MSPQPNRRIINAGNSEPIDIDRAISGADYG
jgi:hypothetical protein